jgi:hypothetical protein
MIGPNGSVVGVEQDPAQIAVAMHRRDGFGFRNVDFRHDDARARSWTRNRSTPPSAGCCSYTWAQAIVQLRGQP